MIGPDVYDENFLDLFAGSGAIGIEALSRGANSATFVEHNKKACDCIRQNLQHTKLDSQATVLQREVIHALYTLDDKKEVFHYIFMDPPYGKDLEKDVLYELRHMSLCDQDTIIIVESNLDTTFSYVEEIGFSIIKEKIYKTNKHTFIRKVCLEEEV